MSFDGITVMQALVSVAGVYAVGFVAGVTARWLQRIKEVA